MARSAGPYGRATETEHTYAMVTIIDARHTGTNDGYFQLSRSLATAVDRMRSTAFLSLSPTR